LLSAVSEVYRNGIVLNNVDKLQNINGGVYGMLRDYNRSERLTSVKNFGLLGPFVSYEENEVLSIQPLTVSLNNLRWVC